ncbi:nucleoside transporter C-terminal domain-containing protein, partial [Staphylococcus epidermidis]|uniref:nucleoside transporter C-terminal domain-containing protein n=1 Tax=Staphylococcus epidermidis TaxID=1282 RepID=UPI0037DA401C
MVTPILTFISPPAIQSNFQTLIPFIFPPFPFLTPIPSQHPLQSPSLIPTKLLSNQFLPIQHLPKPTPLSQHPKPITSLFLLSFPNFTSIPIISPPI